MIDCPNGEMRDRLPDFVHGQLDAAARSEVAAHAASCAACAAELALLQEIRAALWSGPSMDVRRIVSALPAPPSRPVLVRGGLGRPASRRLDWRVAAALVGLLGIGGSAVVISRANGDRGAGYRPAAQVSHVGRRPAVAQLETQRVAAGVSIDAELGDATIAELEEVLQGLESFDGLPAREPEPASPAAGYVETQR